MMDQEKYSHPIEEAKNVDHNDHNVSLEANTIVTVSANTSSCGKRPYTGNFNTDINSNNPSTLVPAKRKRRTGYIRVNPLPRIFKRDIRREYANMFLNVHNSANGFLIRQYFYEFCAPNCHLQVDMPLVFPLPINVPKYKNAIGPEQIACHLIHHLGIFPDIVARMQHPSHDPLRPPEVQLIQREGEPGCEIVFASTMQGTALYYDPFHEPPSQQNQSCRHGGVECVHCEHMKVFGMLHAPIELISHNVARLFVNEDRRIYRISVVGKAQ